MSRESLSEVNLMSLKGWFAGIQGVVGDGDGEGGREGLGCIEYKNRYGSVVECPTAAVNTDSFDGVGGVAQSGSIDDAELIVANVE